MFSWLFKKTKTGLPSDYKKYLDPDAVAIVEQLKKSGFEAYLVGGCVRDVLLKKKPKDFDIATQATPQQVKALIKRCFIIGRRFRIVVAKRNWKSSEIVSPEHGLFPLLDSASEKEFQITTFRRDPVVLNGVTNENVFGSAQEDALRRDFTLNALFLDPVQGRIVDFVGGLPDLNRKILKIIGNPVTRIEEDPIRILRALRFVARAELKLEAATSAAIVEGIPLLAAAKKERVREEVLKCLREGSAEKVFREFEKFNIWNQISPALHDHLEATKGAWERLFKMCERTHATRWTHPRDASPLIFLLLQDFLGVTGQGNKAEGKGDQLEKILEDLKVSKAEREQMDRIRVFLNRIAKDPDARQAQKSLSNDPRHLMSLIPNFYVLKVLADMGYVPYAKIWSAWERPWKEKISGASDSLRRQISTTSRASGARRAPRRRSSAPRRAGATAATASAKGPLPSGGSGSTGGDGN